MSNIPEDVQPYVVLQNAVDLDGTYEAYAAVSDEFAPGAEEDGDRHA